MNAAGLAWLLVALRYRSWRGSLRAGPRVAAARIGLFFAVLVPVAYVGLFATALSALTDAGGRAAADAALALVAGLLVFASFLGKVAAADLVVGRGGEIELLLARPLALSTLVVARGLAGMLTDFFGALFLLPVLIAAALTAALPAPWLAFPVALVTSVAAQVAVAAAAQAGQIALVHVVPPRRRRLCFVVLALAAAGAMAAIWMAGSTVLRAPSATAAALSPFHGWLLAGPGGLLTAPLRRLAAGQGLACVGALAGLVLGAAAALGLAAAVARWAARRGWEQADASWAEAGAGSARTAASPFRAVGLAGKDWRLLLRDRSRLVTLLALPLLFVGVQIFGSAGWAWSTVSPTRIAVCAYSLAAYAATFGPLVHLEAERRAFWILRAVPVSLWRLFAAKAGFWAAVLGGFALATFIALALAAGFPLRGEVLLAGALATAGAVLVAFLAVGLGASEADLSDEQRSALGLSTAYLFMLVSGLYNLVLITAGAERRTAFGLYLVAAVVAFTVGVERARLAFDADELRRRRLSPVLGTLGLVLLFLGHRSAVLMQPVVGGAAAAVSAGIWLGLVALIAVLHRLRAVPPVPRARPPRLERAADLLVLALTAGALVSLVLRPTSAAGHRAALLLAFAGVAAVEEVLARGIIQAGLAPPGSAWSRRLVAAVASAILVLLGGAQRAPLAPLLALGAAVVPALPGVFAVRAPFALSLVLRLVLEGLPLFGLAFLYSS